MITAHYRDVKCQVKLWECLCEIQRAAALYTTLVCPSCPRGTVCLHQLFTDFMSNLSIQLMFLSRVTCKQHSSGKFQHMNTTLKYDCGHCQKLQYVFPLLRLGVKRYPPWFSFASYLPCFSVLICSASQHLHSALLRSDKLDRTWGFASKERGHGKQHVTLTWPETLTA